MDVLEPINPTDSQAWREQIAPGRIWEITVSGYDHQAIQQWIESKFSLALTPPRYVLILERPEAANSDPTSTTVFVMLLSTAIEFLSDRDLLIPAQVSGVPTDLLAETWNTLPMLERYLLKPIGNRLSRKIYDSLLDVEDYHQDNLQPDFQQIQAVGLQIQTNPLLQHKQLDKFHQQQEEIAQLLQFLPAQYNRYQKVLASTEKVLEAVIQEEQEIYQIEQKIIQNETVNNHDSFPACHLIKSSSLSDPDFSRIPLPAKFLGRKRELTQIKHLLHHDQCRILLLGGAGGIGKTALAAKLIKDNQKNFSYIIWCSLQNAPSIEEVVDSLIDALSSSAKRSIAPENIQTKIFHLIKLLKKHPNLIVFDNAESILEIYQHRDDYQKYGELLKRISAEAHSSCLVLTSRDELSDLLAPIEQKHLQIFKLRGIGKAAGIEVCQSKQVTGSTEELSEFVELYQENPLALQIAAGMIYDIAQGKIQSVLETLRRKVLGSNTSRTALTERFQHLSQSEKAIIYCLSINREPLSVLELKQELVTLNPNPGLEQQLKFLVERSLVEQLEETPERFSLHPVVMEYATEHFVEAIYQEIISGKFQFFDHQFLFKAQAKDYIKTIQSRLLIQPLIAKLLSALGDCGRVYDCFIQVLAKAQQQPQYSGYLGGNCLNLLVQMKRELHDCDFSRLTIRQADLQEATLQSVDFTNATLKDSLFTKSLGGILTVAFQPHQDCLATGDTSGQVHLWRIADGEQFDIYQGHTGWVRSLAFSPDGQFLATGGDDKTVRIWNTATRKCKILLGHTKWIRSLAFSPDGRWLVTSSDDRTLRLWDYKTGDCVRIFQGHTDRVRSVAFHPNSQVLASVSSDATFRLWEAATGKCLRCLEGHSGEIRAIVFSPNGEWIASGSSDKTLKLWSVDSDQCVQTFKGHTSHIRAVVFSPDGATLASSSDDQTIKLWTVKTGECCATLQGHKNWIRALAFSPNGRMLASGSSDHTLKLWDIPIRKCLKTIQGYTGRIWSIAFSPDGEWLATGSEDQTLRLWSLHTKHCVQQLKGHSNWIRAVAFSPNGQLLASGGHDATVQLWDVKTGQRLHVLQGHTERVRSVAFHPNGQLLASGAHDATVRLWDVQTGQCRILKEHTSRVRSVAFHPNGRLLASGAHDATVRLWDVQTGQCLRTLQTKGSRVAAIAFSPDGDMLASGGEDQTVSLWNLHTGECLDELQGHASWIQAIAFSPDGQLLASASEDRSIILWNVESRRFVRTLQGHENWVRSVAFSPDGQLLASASEDETIKLWDVSLGTCLETLQNPRPYEGTRITGVIGLTEVQKAALISLGAIE